MHLFQPLSRLFVRFRYPRSTPEDVAHDLGLTCTNLLTFQEFMCYLTNSKHQLTKLSRFMPREQAEEIFCLALRKEKFSKDSLFSYHFKGGWVEFILHFDDQSRLRRVYVRHKDLKQTHEIAISQ